MYLLFNVIREKYEYSFDKLSDLMAYFAHFNVYLDSDHSLIHDLAGNCFNDWAVNYFVSLRVADSWDEVNQRKDISGYKKSTIHKLVKISGVHVDFESSTVMTKDLIILDEDYNVYVIDRDDIEAILSRTCNVTDYKSNLDFPDFKYRFDSVPGTSSKLSGCSKNLKLFRYVRHLSKAESELSLYHGRRFRIITKELVNRASGWDYRYKRLSVSWKHCRKVRKQWQKNISA